MNAPKKSFLSLDLLDNRYPALHGLRVFAIISVIQFHITWIFAGEQNITIDATFRNASLTIFFGMDLFFMLSGFLIGSILLRSLEEHGSQNLRRFYLRRIFRTFPSYYIVLTYLACVTALTASQLHNLRYEYLYVTNFMPLGRGDVIMFWGWSLALEEQFYLVVPLLFFLLWKLRTPRARVVVLTILMLSAGVVRLTYLYAGGPWIDRMFDQLPNCRSVTALLPADRTEQRWFQQLWQIPLYPPTAFDATVYHLPLAKLYAREHQLVYGEYFRVPVFPQNMEMLFTLALLLYDDIFAQLIETLMLESGFLDRVNPGRAMPSLP